MTLHGLEKRLVNITSNSDKGAHVPMNLFARMFWKSTWQAIKILQITLKGISLINIGPTYQFTYEISKRFRKIFRHEV